LEAIEILLPSFHFQKRGNKKMHHFFVLMFQSGIVEAVKEPATSHLFGNILNTATAVTLAVTVRQLKNVEKDVDGLKERELKRLEKNQRMAHA
jgi:hypothetical protein